MLFKYMLLIFFFVFLTFYYQKVFSFHWHPPALRFISNTKPLRYYNERSQNLMECSTEEISFAKYPSSMSNKIFQGSANNNNNNKKKKNMSYPIAFTNLMSCSFSCGDLSKLNESGPLEWEDCSDDVIHLHDSLRKNSFLVKAPEFKLVQIDHKKEVNKSNKLIKNIYIMRSSNTSLSQSSRIKLQVRYSLKDLQSNSYSIGEHALDFNVIVIKNDCHDSFKSETNAGIDMLAFKEGSTVLTCSRKIMIHDNIPPQFTFCPGNREFYLKKNAMSIVFFYDRPIATDNSNNIPRIYQTKGKHTGERLGPGRYFFEFIAEDEQHNYATCQFTVRVYRYVEHTDYSNTRPYDNANSLIIAGDNSLKFRDST